MKRLFLLTAFIFLIVSVYGQGTQVGDSNSPIYHYNGNVGIGISIPSNSQGWNRVLDVRGTSHSKVLATTQDALFKVGIFAHSSWYGGGGFIGTESNHSLHFLVGYAPKMAINVNGNVGIGVNNPSERLEIYGGGNLLIRGSADDAGDLIFRKSDHSQLGRIWTSSSGSSGMYLSSGDNNSDLTIYSNGNIGIGTITPDYKLDVLGTIRANEVKVAAGWSDFVFDQDYDLPTLQEVESYIDQNGHLPDIPSEEEVEENGISLGEMDAKLLQKIEELTLYVIEQQREIKDLKEENQYLKTDLLKVIETIRTQLK